MTEIAVNPLEEISQNIRRAWASAKEQQVSAFEGYFRVGTLLRDARNEFTADVAYGRWLAEQNFGFTRQWAQRLRVLADNQARVEELVETAVSAGEAIPGVNNIIRQLNAPITDDDAEEDEAVIDGTATEVTDETTPYQQLLTWFRALPDIGAVATGDLTAAQQTRLQRESRRVFRAVQPLTGYAETA